MIEPHGHAYPEKELTVVPFPADFAAEFPKPPGIIEDVWPPTQLFYLRVYLAELGCKTMVVENHYVDRDYIQDVSLFYSRSLRSYPNFCQRVHFFADSFDQDSWKKWVIEKTARNAVESRLNNGYLGFSVVRPLPGSPVGRTVLRTFGPVAKSGMKREFTALRQYQIHLGGYDLSVVGVAFQQQDQGVSACATTALWTSLHKVAFEEGLAVPSPAQITESASRYLLADGRSLPSEGLNVQQICEATRAAGLEPIVVRSVDVASDRAQLMGYLVSGFAPVLAIVPVSGSGGHAVCAVGMKLDSVQPQTNPALNFQDGATALKAVYVHDDRLGPYASAEVGPYTMKDGKIATAVQIRWPDQDIEAELSILVAFVVPLPAKVRMSLNRIRALGLTIAQASGVLFGAGKRTTTLNCRYIRESDYIRNAHSFGLSDEGLYELTCKTVLSRFLGLIEISSPEGPLFDVLLDATETRANPSALFFVKRTALDAQFAPALSVIAANCGARAIV